MSWYSRSSGSASCRPQVKFLSQNIVPSRGRHGDGIVNIVKVENNSSSWEGVVP